MTYNAILNPTIMQKFLAKHKEKARTLAKETVTNEPATPTFATYFEYNVGNETEAKENELKLIADELEKVLESIRKENEDENNEIGAAVCPLQDYLFGSVIELPEPVTVKKEKT
ncbi:hypothetical protein L1987_20871 [Smallanthus sonchifolius]|uniref:Uncharacterized protein n=1 Tax=Smallanthus sonchifolius TaxID=185202 RepID=A0ACB9IT05_9ASTR|nr:hypothetical protein L1987_20871 [Smallanthus sonchifolius]